MARSVEGRPRTGYAMAGVLLAFVILPLPAPAAVTNEFPVPTPAAQPGGIATGPDGNLWFTEFAASRIGRITPAGVVTEFPLAPGRGPLGIALGPDNLLYFTERNADRIGRLNPLAGSNAAIQASLIEFIVPGAGSQPTGITLGPDGNLWFTEFGSDEIGRLTTAGILDEFAVLGPGSGPAGIAAGPDGALWFTQAGSSQIGRMTTSGSLTNQFPIPGGGNPEGIALGPDGALWFTLFGADKVGRVTVFGTFSEVLLPIGSGPLDITLGPDGALWVAQAGNTRIGRVTVPLALRQVAIPTPAGLPAGITVGPDGALWFTEAGGNKVGRLLHTDFVGIGAGPGGGPHVRALDPEDLSEALSFFAYSPAFAGGVRVALGDVNGDGVADVIAGAGPGGGPHVRVFSGATGAELMSFFAFPAGFTGGVFVAAGDINGDGRADVIAGAGLGGGPHVRVFSGATGLELMSFFPFPAAFAGGVRVAAGDVNGDGRADILTAAGPGGGPHVKVFSGATGAEIRSFFAYAPAFAGGVFVAAGDVNGDGLADIATGPDAGGGPHVKVFSGATGAEHLSFFAYDPGFLGGVRVAAGDVNGDARTDVLTGPGPGGGPHVKVFSGIDLSLLQSFFAFVPSFTAGVFVTK